MKNFIKEETSLYLTHVGYDKITGKLLDGSSTLLEMIQNRAVNYPKTDAFGAINKSLNIECMSYSIMNNCAKKFGNYLAKITSPGEIVGIATANRPEWLIAEYATYYCNCINSPLYTTFKEEALSYIISITNMRVLVASSSFATIILEKVIGYVQSDLIQLKYIVLIDNDNKVEKMCASKGINVVTIGEILFGDTYEISDDRNTICYKAVKYFENHLEEADITVDTSRGIPKSEDLATISFTSGTTGVPKGVELTHSNFIAQIESFELGIKHYEMPKVDENGLYFSCLPLSHVFERIVVCICISALAKVCFFRGDKTKIGEDIKLVKPTFIAAVPKLLQVFYQKIEEEVSKKKWYERLVYRSAVNFKLFLQRFDIYSCRFLDDKIFKKVAEGFGGRIESVLCGGASMDSNLIMYLRAVLNAHIFQGYGQTEGLGANLLATMSMNDPGSVGIPFPSTKFKLVSVDCSVSGNSDEKAVFLKGYSITRGYFKPSEDVLERLLATGKFNFKISNILETPFDEDGWLITGDVAVYKDGKMFIVGRSKDLVKLDNGEYISPENIENKLRETDFIKDVFISKIPKEDKFVALVSVLNEAVTQEEVAKYLRSSINTLIAKKTIPRCIDISKFAIARQSFANIEDGILFTPTLKKKRFVFAQKFEKSLKNAVSIDDVLEIKSNKKSKKTD